MSPSSEGISPLNWLIFRYNLSRLDRRPRSAGISPLNWFSHKLSSTKLVSLSNSSGIAPLSWFLPSHKRCRLVRLPSSVGNSPIKLLSARPSVVTFPLSSVLTPRHRPMGASVSQPELFVQFAPPVALYSATSTARSCSSLGSGPGGGAVPPRPLTVRVKLPVSPAE